MSLDTEVGFLKLMQKSIKLKIFSKSRGTGVFGDGAKDTGIRGRRLEILPDLHATWEPGWRFSWDDFAFKASFDTWKKSRFLYVSKSNDKFKRGWKPMIGFEYKKSIKIGYIFGMEN